MSSRRCYAAWKLILSRRTSRKGWMKRYLTTCTERARDNKPPLPVRIALVSTSTALCTPLFPAIGFINTCLRVIIPDPNLRYKLSGSIGTIANIAFYYIVPYSYQYSPMLLPFAIGNGICAGAGYAVLDITSGGPSSKLMKSPMVTGGGIGAMTGLLAPPLLYGKLYSLLYGVEGIEYVIQQTFTTVPILSQISCATGFVAGVAMYPMLHYPIHGLSGIHWGYFSGMMLFASGLTTYYLYSPDKEMPMENGAFVCPKDVPLLDSIVRYNVSTGVYGTFSLSTNEWIGSIEKNAEGKALAKAVREYQQTWTMEKRYTFDNQVLTLLCKWLDNDIAQRFPNNIITVKDESELNNVEAMMLLTDWLVQHLLTESKSQCTSDLQIEKMQPYGNCVGNKEVVRRLNSIATTSIGVKVLMAHRIQNNCRRSDFRISDRIPPSSIVEIEKWVRKRAPGIILYKENEKDGLHGQSIESQLISLSWNSQEVEASFNQWKKIVKAEREKKVWTGIIFTSMLLAGTSFI